MGPKENILDTCEKFSHALCMMFSFHKLMAVGKHHGDIKTMKVNTVTIAVFVSR